MPGGTELGLQLVKAHPPPIIAVGGVFKTENYIFVMKITMSWIPAAFSDVFTAPDFPFGTPQLVGHVPGDHEMLFLKNDLLGLAFQQQLATMRSSRHTRTIVYPRSRDTGRIGQRPDKARIGLLDRLYGG